MSRSRSSTVSSRSDSSREYYATNPQQLLAPSHDTARGFAADDLEASVANGSGDGWRDGGAGGESWRSELSLKTVRGRRGSDASDDTLDASGGAGGERAEGGGEGSMLLPKGATIIDLSPATGGRPRAHTFGGVEIPPTPDPSKPVPPTPNPPAPPPHSPPLLRPIPRSRSISNASSVSLHLGGDSWTTRRPVLWAGCKGAMLLACSLAFLWLVLHTLLPPLDEGDEQYVKIPKSFDQLKELNGVLQVYKERHYWRVLGCYMTVYLL
ncbi:SNARE associated Golgi protein [Pseudohyphozyma bogoriensis]|nr:SNARE associated Golgi protein [Pseudohyphozyma bogoriensis]